MNIIVVDDDIKSLAKFLSYIVKEDDLYFQMFQLHSTKVLKYIKNNTVDGAFLDINNAEDEGIALAEELIKISHNIMLIFTCDINQLNKSTSSKIKNNLLNFCCKPYTQESILQCVADIRNRHIAHMIKVKTFGGFDIFVGGEMVKFSSSKSKELLALLIDRRGGTVLMNDIIACLWGDKNIEQSKRLYRDAVYRLRMTLNEYNIASLVEFARAKLILNKAKVNCDFWDYIDKGVGVFLGIYMQSYEWSIDTQMFLERGVVK